MWEFLVGSGLAASAGLNAWMPLLTLGLADRFLGFVQLPAAWSWISSDIALWILGALLVIEIVADKIPVVDSINDVIQTVIRPASGGVVFGAGSSAETLRVDDPATFFENTAWVPILIGIAIALGVHLAKSALRAAATSATLGMASPALSMVGDVASFTLAASAIVVPLLALAIVILGVVAVILTVRRLRRRCAGRVT